jgi:hypothetical protein
VLLWPSSASPVLTSLQNLYCDKVCSVDTEVEDHFQNLFQAKTLVPEFDEYVGTELLLYISTHLKALAGDDPCAYLGLRGSVANEAFNCQNISVTGTILSGRGCCAFL